MNFEAFEESRMLNILGSPQRVCNGLTRRSVIQAGGAGLFGLHASHLSATPVSAPPFQHARAKSVIFLYLFGGPSQLETWDMKPDAPSNLRGPYVPIDTRTPELRLCELMPRSSLISDKFCVIRTMTHQENDHNAAHYIQTGHKWTRVAANGQDVNARDTDWPSMGSVVEYLSIHHPGNRNRDLPDYFYLPNRLGHIQIPKYDRTGQYAGWLGSAYNGLAANIRPKQPRDNPFLRTCTEEELDFSIKGLLTDKEISLDRLDRRKTLLDQFDLERRRLDQSSATSSYSQMRGEALSFVTSPAIREALDIRRETSEIRDRYGRHLFGQSVLMSRRLIEAGSRFVTVSWDGVTGIDGWDSHYSNDQLGKHLIPGFDQAYSALLEDLDKSGLLDETLVVALGEMGRSPKPVNNQWGRNHWSFCFPCLLAGAGVRGGIVHGRSDADAAYPLEQSVSPEDLASTIYWSLGIDSHLMLQDKLQRPVSIVEGGRILDSLFG